MSDENNEMLTEQSPQTGLVRLFNETRKRLVETGTRNRLIHVNRANVRGNVINLVNERSDDVYAILSTHKAMRFLAIGRDRDDDGASVRLADAGELAFDHGRYTDAYLETRMGPDALQKRLLKIAREAQTAEEESGVNILYLALGFLTWFEDKSTVAREAPLVLLPVELTRNLRTSTYDVRIRDDELVTNLPLQQRLKDDFGIQLPEIHADEEWIPSSYFEQVREVIHGQRDWRIESDAMQLGFFSFSKLLMYRDLALEAWPEGAIANHGLTRGLLFEGFEPAPSIFDANDKLDDMLPPEKLLHVVDADASQARVIEEVRSGRNLVVQGPPGTGKSQTITNIIAAAVKDGKRVLFLAEKMAALSVVHDRLVRVGLRDVCLELHSRNVNKNAVLAELARTLGAAAAVPSTPGAPADLTAVRDRLNQFTEALHLPIGNTGATPFSVLGVQTRYIGLGVPAPDIESAGLSTMTEDSERRLLDTIRQYGDSLRKETSSEKHPFEGTRNLELQPVDLKRLETVLSEARDALSALALAVNEAIAQLRIDVPIAFSSVAPLDDVLARLEGMPAGAVEIAKALLSAGDIARIKQTVTDGATWRSERDAAEATFVESAFSVSTITLRGALAAGVHSFFTRWGGAYRRASRELAGLLRGALPKSAKDRLELLDRLGSIEACKLRWERDLEYCAHVLQGEWRGELTDFHRLSAIAAWCERLDGAALRCVPDALLSMAADAGSVAAMRKALHEREAAARRKLGEVVGLLDLEPRTFGEGGPDRADLNAFAKRCDEMARSTDRYAGWSNLTRLHNRIEEAGVPDLARRMQSGELDSGMAAIELRYARAERLWHVARESVPILRDMALEDKHDLVALFGALERQRLSENVTSILAGHLAQVPQGALGEMKVVRGEIGKKRGHIALRKLFQNAGTAVQRIKPVLLMSPISVAQFIPPGALEFDLLVIDEASQVRPEDALGAIARATQIVVVGDQKQLPPSSFFDRLLADESDEEPEEEDDGLLGNAAKLGMMESILSLCEARGLSSRMLRWHYRSRDPSLISVSNHEFYEDGLILPPSPLQEDPAYGLCFTRVDGVYDKGGKRDNRKEGAAIVERVAEHARLHPGLSLGIVTFSSAQKTLITELLEFARRSDPALDAFLREGQSEDVFVKNIENVQGDERDVILVSVCYGPTVAGGRLTSMTFGPVNLEGGERRLNVLFTRARVRCEVFASFDPADIDPSRTTRQGTRILKRFLDFANGGLVNDAEPTGLQADTPFEADVADVIRSLGYLVDSRGGSAGFRIDIGVRHPDRPGTYIAAVECDGQTYHSAQWARERDRLRQDVLEHLGWRFHRIWSTDWFYSRSIEIERLRVALDDARTASEAGVKIEGANRARPVPAMDLAMEAPPSFDVSRVEPRQMPAYRRAHFPVTGGQEPHEVAVAVLADLVKRIVDVEGPIHIEETARRLAACFGKEKAGARIVTKTREALSHAQSHGQDLLSDGTFWFTCQQSEAPPVRDRSAESGATIKPLSISMLEVTAALTMARNDNAGGAESDLIRTAARLLGFRRVGPDLQERLAAGLEQRS